MHSEKKSFRSRPKNQEVPCQVKNFTKGQRGVNTRLFRRNRMQKRKQRFEPKTAVEKNKLEV